MDQLDIRAGDHVVHIGAGTGYYSAILAMVVGSTGQVTAIEVDPVLASQLQKNLSDFPQVETVQASGTAYSFEPADVVYVNAGVTHPEQNWLNRLRPGGRMILPLTEMGSNRYGGMLWIKRYTEAYAARFLSSLRIYPCAGARDERAEALLAEAFERGGYEEVRSLRRDCHEREPDCWLHGDGYCLSCRLPLF
jgi:protein-L-isoaspartate(D-aspartate) O-methyltransferase